MVFRFCYRAVVDRAVVGNGARRNVDDFFVAPVDIESRFFDYFAEDRVLDIPLFNDCYECVFVFFGDDCHHALLAFAHEDFFRG